MSVAIFGGAGGDGKTTILQLLAQYDTHLNKTPLLIDANPDQNLADFFGLSAAQKNDIPAISNHWDDLRDALEGENPHYPNKDHIVDTSPITPHSKLWNIGNPDDVILNQYSRLYDGIRFMRTGTYEAKDIGSGCLHDKIGTLNFMLTHMDNTQNSTVLIDNAHGRDAFGTPLYAQGDILIVTACPTEKSIEIMMDYLNMADQLTQEIGFEINIAVVGNRFSTNDRKYKIQEKIFQNLTQGRYVGALKKDPALDRGMEGALDQMIKSGFNFKAKSGREIFDALKKPSVLLDKLHQASNVATIATLYNKIALAKPDRTRQAAWTHYCLQKATYLDQLIDPSVRQQTSEHGGSCHGHHHQHCTHG
jgi:CO dehydrogenase nickel-insertion accessory protein CooC1